MGRTRIITGLWKINRLKSASQASKVVFVFFSSALGRGMAMNHKDLRLGCYPLSVTAPRTFNDIDAQPGSAGNQQFRGSHRGLRLSALQIFFALLTAPGPVRGMVFAFLIEAAGAAFALCVSAAVVYAMHLLAGVR